MKRPFAVIGFSMLSSFLVIPKLTFNQTVAVLLTATVLFCLFLNFKKTRKKTVLLTILLSVAIFSTSFIFAQNEYVKLTNNNMQKEIKGVVCQTPTNSDYANTYIIKVYGENYKVRYVSQSDRNFKQGDIVSGKIIRQENKENIDYFESALASKIYFNCFENDENKLDLTKDKNLIYYYSGMVKEWFTDVVGIYLPCENGAIANAMAIGDRTGLSDGTTTMFNYSGISHLLVVSGLHLSLWSLGIIKILQKKEKIRKYVVPIGLMCLIGYSVLTGLSVSVIRAGLMVGFVLIGKLFKRDADSLNSIGCAVIFIVLSNPFSPYSASLWLTVLSTTGILVFYEPIKDWILSFKAFNSLEENGFIDFVVTSVAISLATAVFTAPVFIIHFKMMPIASIIANLLAVDLAMALMILTVFGVFCHLFNLLWLSQISFSIVGSIGTFLQTVAKTIGSSEYSTISVASPIFDYFLIFAIGILIIAYYLKKHNKNIFKGAITLLSVVFVLTTLFTMAYDYNTVSIHINNANDNIITLANYQGDTTVFGCPNKKQARVIRDIMMTHNEKRIDNIATDAQKISILMNLEKSLLADKNCKINEMSDQYKVIKNEYGTEITYKNVKLLLINDFTYENCFENTIKYDIIIINMLKEDEKLYLSSILQNENSLLIDVKDGETISINCKWEKFYATYN